MAQRLKVLALCGAVAALVGTTAPTSAGSLGDHSMYITFSRAVALPGVELAAGTYVFELALPMSDLSLVRVSSKDHRRVYLTAFTYAIDRPATLGARPVVTLGEAAAGAAPSIKAWFPEGTGPGRGFIYRN